MKQLELGQDLGAVPNASTTYTFCVFTDAWCCNTKWQCWKTEVGRLRVYLMGANKDRLTM